MRAWVERFLLLVGMLCLGYYGYAHIETFLYQRYEDRELNAILATHTSAVAPPADMVAPARVLAPGSVVGRLEVARLGVSAVVRAGTDARTLRLAVGHIGGTALPGGPGNAGFAGHRDTFFRRLQNIRPDDEIRIVTPDGTFRYRVDRTMVVNPADVWVLDQTPTPVLTLVTCYPFTYVGSAPQRFVVRASLRDTDTTRAMPEARGARETRAPAPRRETVAPRPIATPHGARRAGRTANGRSTRRSV